MLWICTVQRTASDRLSHQPLRLDHSRLARAAVRKDKHGSNAFPGVEVCNDYPGLEVCNGYLGFEVCNVLLGVAGLQLEVAAVDPQRRLHRHARLHHKPLHIAQQSFNRVCLHHNPLQFAGQSSY